MHQKNWLPSEPSCVPWTSIIIKLNQQFILLEAAEHLRRVNARGGATLKAEDRRVVCSHLDWKDLEGHTTLVK